MRLYCVFVNKAAADTEKPTAFTATKGTVTYNSVALVLNATDNSGVVAFDITYGTTTVSTSALSGVSKTYTVTGLDPLTAYNFSVVVVAVEKFTIPDAKLLRVQIMEKNGGRHLKLKVTNSKIVKAVVLPDLH